LLLHGSNAARTCVGYWFAAPRRHLAGGA